MEADIVVGDIFQVPVFEILRLQLASVIRNFSGTQANKVKESHWHERSSVTTPISILDNLFGFLGLPFNSARHSSGMD